MNYMNNKKDKSNSIFDLTGPKPGKKGQWKKYLLEMPKTKPSICQMFQAGDDGYKNYDNPGHGKSFYGKPPKGNTVLEKCLALETVPFNHPDQGCTFSFRIIARPGKPEYAVIPMPSGKDITIGVHVNTISEDGDGRLASAVLEKTIDGRTEAAAPTLRIGTMVSIVKGVTLKVIDIGKDSEGDYVDIIIETPGKRDAKKAIALARVLVDVAEQAPANVGEKKPRVKMEEIMEMVKIEKILKS